MAPRALVFIGDEIGETLAPFRGERHQSPGGSIESFRPRLVPLVGDGFPTCLAMPQDTGFHQPQAGHGKGGVGACEGFRANGPHGPSSAPGEGKGFRDDRSHGEGEGVVVRHDGRRAPFRKANGTVLLGVIAKQRMGQGVGKAGLGRQRSVLLSQDGKLGETLRPRPLAHGL